MGTVPNVTTNIATRCTLLPTLLGSICVIAESIPPSLRPYPHGQNHTSYLVPGTSYKNENYHTNIQLTVGNTRSEKEDGREKQYVARESPDEEEGENATSSVHRRQQWYSSRISLPCPPGGDATDKSTKQRKNKRKRKRTKRKNQEQARHPLE